MKSRPPPKTARKSSRPRIALTFAPNVPPYEPSEADWTRAEAVYERPFLSKERKKIISAVNTYFQDAAAEKDAPFKSDIIEQVEEISDTTKQLLQLILSSGDRKLSILKGLLDTALVESSYEESALSVGAIGSILVALRVASDRVRADVEREEGFEEGQAWRVLINRLSDLLDALDLSTGVAHDGKSKFASFVQEIQNSFPLDYRRHQLGDLSSLSKAITRARGDRDIRRRKRLRSMSRRDTRGRPR